MHLYICTSESLYILDSLTISCCCVYRLINAFRNGTSRPVAALYFLYLTRFPCCSGPSPNYSVDIHVVSLMISSWTGVRRRLRFLWTTAIWVASYPSRLFSTNCSLYGWAELISETFRRFPVRQHEPLNTGRFVGCVSSSLPAAAQQQHLNNSKQHNSTATWPRYRGIDTKPTYRDLVMSIELGPQPSQTWTGLICCRESKWKKQWNTHKSSAVQNMKQLDCKLYCWKKLSSSFKSSKFECFKTTQSLILVREFLKPTL